MADESKPAEAPKPKKTQLARDAAVAVLKAKKEPMKMADIVEAVLADPAVKAAGVSKSTIQVQVGREANGENPRIVKTASATYQIKK
jgi:hypothetical protein